MRRFKWFFKGFISVLIVVAARQHSCAQSAASLITKADSLYQAKAYALSATTYAAAFKIGKAKPIDYYNGACSAALAGQTKMAFTFLDQAIKNGWTNLQHLQKDADLTALHQEKEWPKMVGKLEKKLARTEANYDKPLQAELLAIFETDQQIRHTYINFTNKFGYNHPKVDSVGAIMRYQDSINLQKIIPILEKYGWVGSDKVGAQASQTIFLVIQHSDLQTQEKYLPLMREAVQKGKASKSSLALLEDRVAIRQGKPQIYGSQIGWDEKTQKHFVLPLIDPQKVDQRRAKLDLPPLAEYVKQWNIKWDPAANQQPGQAH